MQGSNARLTYYLARGLVVRGALEASGVMHIEGVFQGTIQGEGVLIVGRHSQIESAVEIDTMVIAGSFNGDVVARHKVSILQGATVRGTVQSPVCDVEYGAHIDARMSIANHEPD